MNPTRWLVGLAFALALVCVLLLVFGSRNRPTTSQSEEKKSPPSREEIAHRLIREKTGKEVRFAVEADAVGSEGVWVSAPGEPPATYYTFRKAGDDRHSAFHSPFPGPPGIKAGDRLTLSGRVQAGHVHFGNPRAGAREDHITVTWDLEDATLSRP